MGVLGETTGLKGDGGIVLDGDFWVGGTGVGGNLWAKVRGGLAVDSWEGLGGTGEGSDLGGWYGSGARGDNCLLVSSAGSEGRLASSRITRRRNTKKRIDMTH